MNRSHLARLTTAAVLGLAVAAPAAQAAAPDAPAPVCNEASPHFLGGEYTPYDGDPTPPARYADEQLQTLRGNGAGLLVAAAKSPALQQCEVATGGGWGGSDS